MTFTPDDLAELIAVLDSADVDRLHLRTARMAITLRRGTQGLWQQSMQVLTEPVLTEPDVATPTDPVTLAGGEPVPGEGLIAVRAPLVGTFYRAPAPGQPPFVEVGSRVEASTVVGIVETMKLMNSVPAGVVGTVHELPVADAQPVPQGGVLVLIRPDSPDSPDSAGTGAREPA